MSRCLLSALGLQLFCQDLQKTVEPCVPLAALAELLVLLLTHGYSLQCQLSVRLQQLLPGTVRDQ